MSKLSPAQALFLATVKAEGRVEWHGHESGWWGARTRFDNALQAAYDVETNYSITSATGRALVKRGLLLEVERGCFTLAPQAGDAGPEGLAALFQIGGKR